MLESKVIPNMVQGVSQQASSQRRDSQCEAQYDCINSPKDGAVSRHGFDLIKRHAGLDLSGAWFYELSRGLTEHYLVAIKGGVCRVFNLGTGALCTVTVVGAAGAYIAQDGGDPAANFVAQTVDDFTFIATKAVAPAMSATLSPARPKEGLVFFRAGSYSTTYTLVVGYGGTDYRWAYTTPDNSVAANAKYIDTGQIAATFWRAMMGSSPTGSSGPGTGSSHAGDDGTVGDVYGPATLPAGFELKINGSLLYIKRTDDADFTLAVSDGGGDTQVTAIKDNIRSFSDLPQGGFEGFVARVRGKSAEDNSSDYYVQYVEQTATNGYWQETVKPGTATTINPATMPHALVNTGLNTFELRPQVWSPRIAGDGVITARSPGFIGRRIEALGYHKGRLLIETEATADWSKARNVYTFFPDTVQTVLADAPIGIELAAADTIALMRKVVQMDESLMLWAQGAQFRVHSGQDPFRQDTVAADFSTAYEFAEGTSFTKVGNSLYFATEPDDWAQVRVLQFQNGRPLGDVDVTDHVPELVPAGVNRMSASDVGKMVMVQSSGAPQALYPYNFLIQSQQIVQSAWNTWRLPKGTIEWSSIYRMEAFVALQRADGFCLLKTPLRTTSKDPGGQYRTRMDLRVSEAECSVVYDDATRRSTITLPYALYAEEAGLVLVALRTSGSDEDHPLARGRLYDVISASGATVVVEGDLTGYQFYAGLKVAAMRQESTFYIRGPQGVVETDSLVVREYGCRHDGTGYYRIEVDQGAGRLKTVELKPIPLGQANNVLGVAPGLVKGKLSVAVDKEAEECTITLINDSILPSRWQSAEYKYEAVLRARPSRVRSGE